AAPEISLAFIDEDKDNKKVISASTEKILPIGGSPDKKDKANKETCTTFSASLKIAGKDLASSTPIEIEWPADHTKYSAFKFYAPEKDIYTFEDIKYFSVCAKASAKMGENADSVEIGLK